MLVSRHHLYPRTFPPCRGFRASPSEQALFPPPSPSDNFLYLCETRVSWCHFPRPLVWVVGRCAMRFERRYRFLSLERSSFFRTLFHRHVSPFFSPHSTKTTSVFLILSYRKSNTSSRQADSRHTPNSVPPLSIFSGLCLRDRVVQPSALFCGSHMDLFSLLNLSKPFFLLFLISTPPAVTFSFHFPVPVPSCFVTPYLAF